MAQPPQGVGALQAWQENFNAAKALKSIDVAKTLKSIDVAKTLEGFDAAKALEGFDTAKALKSIDVAKVLEGFDAAKALEGFDTAKALKSIDVAKALKSIDVAKTLEGFDPAEAVHAWEDDYDLDTAKAVLWWADSNPDKAERETELAASLLDRAIRAGALDGDAPETLPALVDDAVEEFSWPRVAGSVQLWITLAVALCVFAGKDVSPEMQASLNLAVALVFYLASQRS